jgi:hypothetical protein
LNKHQALAKRYVSGLLGYIDGGGEEALILAYDIGREAIRNGLGILDVVALNTETSVALMQHASSPEEALRITKAAGKFLLEALAPFEMIVTDRRG